MKCRFCNASAYGRFKVESFDGHEIEYDLCVEDALLTQAQGYDVKLIEKYKDGEKKDEEQKGKEKEKV